MHYAVIPKATAYARYYQFVHYQKKRCHLGAFGAYFKTHTFHLESTSICIHVSTYIVYIRTFLKVTLLKINVLKKFFTAMS